MRPTLEHFEHVFTHDHTATILLLTAVGVIISTALGLPYVAVLNAVAHFAAFDAVVFRHIHQGNEQDMQGRAYYRVVQAVYQYGLLILLWHFFGWWSVLYMALWWVGLCDWLYYVLLGFDPIDPTGNMYWVDWTVQGIVCKLILRRNLTGREFHVWTWILTVTIGVAVFVLQRVR